MPRSSSCHFVIIMPSELPLHLSLSHFSSNSHSACLSFIPSSSRSPLLISQVMTNTSISHQPSLKKAASPSYSVSLLCHPSFSSFWHIPSTTDSPSISAFIGSTRTEYPTHLHYMVKGVYKEERKRPSRARGSPFQPLHHNFIWFDLTLDSPLSDGGNYFIKLQRMFKTEKQTQKAHKSPSASHVRYR